MGGSGGGVSGAVSFPSYIQETHGLLLAGSGVDSSGNYSGTDDEPDLTIIQLLNSAWSSDPFDGFSYTNPSSELAENKAQFDLYFAAATSLNEDNYSSYITQALLAATNPTTGQLPELAVSLATSAPSTPQNLFTSFATTARSEIAKFLSNAQGDIQSDVENLLASAASTALNNDSLTATTTLWRTFLSVATTELGKCDFPKEVSSLQVINEAASNASVNLKAALRIVRDLISGSILDDVVTEFEGRRAVSYQQQVSQFAGTMADINAVNSTGFLFGVALLKAEQLREVAEFDSQVSLSLLQQGLSSYIQTHNAQMQVSAQAALANTRAHNALLESTINLLATLSQREEITPSNLLSLYTGLFQAELASFTNLGAQGLGNQANLYSQNINRDRVNHTLNLEADRLNKIAKEQRYIQGLSQILNIITNKVEFQRAAATLLTEQNRIKVNLRSEYEGDQLDIDVRDELWEMEVAREGALVLAAPAGMSAALPKNPSKARSAVGGALQGAGAGASTGAVIGAAGGPIGAGAGAVIGAGAGLLGGLLG